jgi:hypothetical protein
MYRCTRCQTVVPPRTRQHLLVETRPARYPHRPQVYRVRGKERIEYLDDPGGTGHEIARAVPVCPDCAARANSAAP